MRGNINWQVHEVFSSILHIGESKHEAKLEAREYDKVTPSEIAENTGIYSYRTADMYRDIAKDCMTYAKETFGLKDLTKLDANMVKSYLENKVDNGISFKTCETYAGALGKLGTALNEYTQTQNYNFREVLSEVKEVAHQDEHTNRAYDNPQKIISNLSSEAHQLVATLQSQYGLRVSEASYIKLSQLDGNTLTVQGKGGYILHKELTQNIADNIKNQAINGLFTVGYGKYTQDLKNACERSGEAYNGTHGFRYSYAQERVTELMQAGSCEQVAKAITSEELGHHRIDITDHYLKN